MRSGVHHEDVRVEAEPGNVRKHRAAAVEALPQARAGLEEEGEGEVIRPRGAGAEEGAVEREAVAVEEVRVRAEGERAEGGVVGGRGVWRGGEGCEEGESVEKRARGGEFGECEGGYEAGSEGG